MTERLALWWRNIRDRNGKMRSIASQSSIHASVDFIPVIDRNPLEDAGEDASNHDDAELKGGGWGARHSMVFLGTLGVVLLVTIRNNLSITIVAMVAKAGPPTIDENSTVNGTIPFEDTCPEPDSQDSASQGNIEQTGEFYWDERTQGLILGAYFYGNVVTNLIGGRVAEHVGGKLMFGLGILLSAVFALLSPIAVRISTKLFLAARLLTGVAQGFAMPAVTRCLVTWIPPCERSKFNTVVFSGADIGTVISMALGGYLCSLKFMGGWPLPFYVFGSLGVAWSFLWFLLVTEKPECHPRISEDEKEYILAHCKVKRGKPISLPWLSILTSVPLWSVFIMHIGHNWAYYTFLTLLPSYLSNMQHFEMKSNGILSALPYASKWLFGLLYSFLMSTLLAFDKLSTLSVRRISMAIGSFIPSLGLVLLSVVGCDQWLAVTLLVASMAFCGASFCGYFCSHQDLSPNLAGTLFGISNFMANMTGFAAPGLAGAILLNNQTLSAWSLVFFISAGVYSAACAFYVIFISTEVQHFNNPQQRSQCTEGEDENLNIPNKC